MVGQEIERAAFASGRGMSASAYRYATRPDRKVELRQRILTLAQRHKRWPALCADNRSRGVATYLLCLWISDDKHREAFHWRTFSFGGAREEKQMWRRAVA